DEVPGGVWQGSPAVQTYLKSHDLTSVDDLWFVFYGRVAQILKAQEGGLLPSGWEEIAVRKTQRGGQQTNIPNPDFAALGWRGYVWNNVPGGGAEDLAYRLANGGLGVGVGARSRLGQGARPRQVRVPVPRGLVPLRQRAWPARAAAARSGGPGCQLPDSHARSQGPRRRGLLQPGATGLHPALHDRRQRAHRAQRPGPRSDPVPRDDPRGRVQRHGPQGAHGPPHG